MTESSDKRLKPLFIVKPDTMSRRDILRAEKHSGVCIVECSEPESARFLDAPVDAQLDVQARAALSLMRVITSQTGPYQRGELLKFFVDHLLNSKAPPNVPAVPPVKGR